MIRYAYITHRGNVRQENQDALLVNGEVIQDELDVIVSGVAPDTGSLIFAVADGLGRHDRPALASRFALQRLAELSEDIRCQNDLLEVLEKVNTEICAMHDPFSTRPPMGTTCAGLLFLSDREEVLAFSVGDSRVYSLLNHLTQITVDQRGASPDLVRQTIGGTKSPEPLSPSFVATRWPRGGGFLICSDGLSDCVDPTLGCVFVNDDHVALANKLYLLARSRPCRDNVSLLVVIRDNTDVA